MTGKATKRALALAFCLLAGLMPGWAVAQELLLTNAQIVDPGTRTVRSSALLIRNGKIVANRVPQGFAGPVLDLKGKWVIPGLNDLHTHSFGNQPFMQDGDTPGTAGIAARVLAVGVTGLLDLFGDEKALFQLRAQQRAGEIGGADIFTSLSCLTAPKGHCTEYGIPTRTMSTPAQARAVVADLARSKPDVVKIVYQPTNSLPSIDKATLAAAVSETKRHGLKTILHIDTWEQVGEAMDVGATAVTHMPDTPIPAGMAARMARTKLLFMPTLAVEGDAMNFAFDAEVLDNPMARAMTKPSVIAAYRNPKFLAQAQAKRAQDEARNANALANVKAAADAGVIILLGTDAGNWGVLQGYSVHRELALMVKAGLSPWQALASSTTNAGKFLGRRFGIDAGDEANLVVLDASPIDDIRNTQKIAMVIHHGKVLDRDALLASPIAGLKPAK